MIARKETKKTSLRANCKLLKNFQRILVVYALIVTLVLVLGGAFWLRDLFIQKMEIAPSIAPVMELADTSNMQSKKQIALTIVALSVVIIGLVIIGFFNFKPPSKPIPAVNLVISEAGNGVDTLDKIIEKHVETILKQNSIGFNKIQDAISQLRADAFYKQSVGTIDGGSNLPKVFSFRKIGE